MYVLSELRNDEQKLRMAITAALEPKPWRHGMVKVWDSPSTYRCWKCHLESPSNLDGQAPACPVPDAFISDLAVAAERLVNAVMDRLGAPEHKLTEAIKAMNPPGYFKDSEEPWMWMATVATPAEKCIVCLLALGQAREDEE